MEQRILDGNCPICQALHHWRACCHVNGARVLFPSMFPSSHFCPFSLSLSADPTLQSDMQLLLFPETKTCFEWRQLLKMSPLKIKQLSFNCFSSALAPILLLLIRIPFHRNRRRNMKAVYFDPYYSVLSAVQLMECNGFDSPWRYRITLHVCVCVHGCDAVCVAETDPRWCNGAPCWWNHIFWTSCCCLCVQGAWLNWSL